MQRVGSEALFVGTGGVVGAYTGLDDVGTASLSECLEIAGWIVDSVEIPVIMALLTAPGMWPIACASPALMSRLSAPSRSGRARRRLGGCIEIACGRVTERRAARQRLGTRARPVHHQTDEARM